MGSPKEQKLQLPEASGADYSPHIDKYPFENLVLKGGGAKGIAYIGACKILDEAGILDNITRFAGTSAGAITAALLAIGMSPQDMLDELSQKNLMDLLDPPVTKGWFSFLNWFPSWLTVKKISMAIGAVTGRGLCEGDEFKKWFRDILDRNLKRLHPDKKGLDGDITFDTLYHTLGVELCIVAYNMVFGNETYFHVKTTPMMKIQEAVRMSMSIPGVFKPYEKIPGFTFIDGGLAANYPLWAFDGWYLSMEKEDTFQERLASITDDDQKEGKIRRMFYPEYRHERFGPRNDRTLGILMFSSSDREMYQEQFEKRLDKVNFRVKKHEETELYKKYKKARDEREKKREASKKSLKTLVGDGVRKLIQDIEGVQPETLPDFISPVEPYERMKKSSWEKESLLEEIKCTAEAPDDLLGCSRLGDKIKRQDEPTKISKEEAKKRFNQIFKDEDIEFLQAPSKDKAFEMLMLDNDGKLTTDKLRNIYQNVGPLQLARRTYLGLRLVKSPRQYCSAMLEFVGNNSGINEEDIHRSVAIDVGYVGTMDFDMEPKDMEFLMRQGAGATIAFLEEKKGSS